MKKMQTELSDALAKMDNDALSAVRDFLAPTLEKVKETASALEKFSFTTGFKLTALQEKKESKKPVNPFKAISGLYSEDILRSFISAKPSSRPHVFSTAKMAYQGICERQRSQTSQRSERSERSELRGRRPRGRSATASTTKAALGARPSASTCGRASCTGSPWCRAEAGDEEAQKTVHLAFHAAIADLK